MKISILSILLIISFLGISQSYAKPQSIKGWRVYHKKGIQILDWNNPTKIITTDFFKGLYNNPHIKTNLPTLIRIHSNGGEIDYRTVSPVLPHGRLEKLFSDIEEKSKTPIHVYVSLRCASFCNTVYTSFVNRVADDDARFGFHSASASGFQIYTGHWDPIQTVLSTKVSLDYLVFRGISQQWIKENDYMWMTHQVTWLSGTELAVNDSNYVNRGSFKNFKKVANYLKSENARKAQFQFYRKHYDNKELKIGRIIKDEVIYSDFKNDINGVLLGTLFTFQLISPPFEMSVLENNRLIKRKYYHVKILNNHEFDYETEITEEFNGYFKRPGTRLLRPYFIPADIACLYPECNYDPLLTLELEKLIK